MPPPKKAKPLKAPGKVDAESMICKRKLDLLQLQESQSTDDRFTSEEKKLLLEAYNANGYGAFQDMKLLSQYLPNRTESDLSGLLQRLKSGLISRYDTRENRLENWHALCSNLMGNFARDKRVNIDNALSDALEMAASRLEECDRQCEGDSKPNYPELIRSFCDLLAGKFPDDMTKVNAAISKRLFDHINFLAESSRLINSSNRFKDGTWITEATSIKREELDHAKKKLNELSDCPTVDDDNKSIFLELPKMKRIVEFLNPLRLDMDSLQ